MEQASSVVTLPAVWAFVPLIGAAVACAALALFAHAKGRPHPSTCAYIGLFVAGLLFVALWCARGLCETEMPAVVVGCSAVLCACGVCVLARERLFDGFGLQGSHAREGKGKRGVRDVLLLAVACVLSLGALEFSTNPGFGGMPARSLAISVASILLALVALYFVAQRRGGLPAVVPVALFVAGLAEYFVVRFKDMALLPSDLFAASTAFAVSGHFTFYLTAYPLCALALCALAVLVLAFVVPRSFGNAPYAWARHVGNLVLAAVCAAGVGALLANPAYQRLSGVQLEYFVTADSYRTYGFLPSFAYAVHDLAVPRPQGYSDEQAVQLEEQLSANYDAGAGAQEANRQAAGQFAQQQPNIVVVMNESYADLSIFDGLGIGYQGPPWLSENPPGTLMSGSLTVPVLSGGTCNTEFEFLTGAALGFLGAGKYPYQQFDLSEAPSLARQLAQLGYGTHAIHPAPGTNWSRESVYAQLGFERMHFGDEFEGAPMYNWWPDDGPTYDLALQIIQQQDAPQFVFDVTTQNHASYNQGFIDEADLPGVEVAGLDAETNAELNGYLACIGKSDDYLRTFVQQLAKLDEPVVLVFFGDHQPGLTPALNDCLFPDEAEPAHSVRLYTTPYFVWANYDVAGRAQDGAQHQALAASYLAAVLMQQVGGPLSNYQKAKLELMGDVALLGGYLYQAPDGAWYGLDEASPSAQQIGQMATMQYRYVH